MTYATTRINRLRAGDLVEVRTPDFTTMSRWRDRKDAGKERPSTISVIGYFLNVDADVIRLNGMHVDDEDGPEIGQLAIIPRNTSITIRRLSGSQKRPGRPARNHRSRASQG